MKIIGVDLHTQQQALAMLEDRTGELVQKEPLHEGNQVREFYFVLPRRPWWASKPPGQCTGSCDFWKNSVSTTEFRMTRCPPMKSDRRFIRSSARLGTVVPGMLQFRINEGSDLRPRKPKSA